MNREETLTVLKQNGIAFELFEHPAIFNMEEAAEIDLPWPEDEAKNLFVRDSRNHYCLISVPGNCRVDLATFRRAEGLGSLSFVREQEMQERFSMTPGAVTPLGLLQDTARLAVLYLDEAFREGLIGVHPNDNRATVFLKSTDLAHLIESQGTIVRWRRFSLPD